MGNRGYTLYGHVFLMKCLNRIALSGTCYVDTCRHLHYTVCTSAMSAHAANSKSIHVEQRQNVPYDRQQLCHSIHM